jgi:uncharacterized membrane protein YgdD (TMEM256/DUF423 family)
MVGAFAAHSLKDVLSPYALDIVETGAKYQMYHALATILAGVLARTFCPITTRLAGWCFVGGSIVFAGSLYLLAATDARWLGAITPVGGVLFLLGWGLLVLAAARKPR